MGVLHKLTPRGKGARKKKQPAYVLGLFTTGRTPRSATAIQNLREICENVLKDNYRLEVVDIYQEPGRASHAAIIAAPTLVKYAPRPERRIIGDLSDHDKVI